MEGVPARAEGGISDEFPRLYVLITPHRHIQPNRNNNMKRAIFPAVTAIVCALAFISCQPTPEEEAVVNKGGSVALEAKRDRAAGATLQVDEHWTDSLSADRFVVHIDADVIVPDVEKFPVVGVAPRDFTQEDADTIIKGLFGDQQLYAPKTEADKTKDDILQEIVDHKESGFTPDFRRL